MSDIQNTQQHDQQKPEEQLTDEALESVAGGVWDGGIVGGGCTLPVVKPTIARPGPGDVFLTIVPPDTGIA